MEIVNIVPFAMANPYLFTSCFVVAVVCAVNLIEKLVEHITYMISIIVRGWEPDTFIVSKLEDHDDQSKSGPEQFSSSPERKVQINS